MHYYDSIIDVIGNTPLVKINQLNPNKKVLLLAKLEFMNPGGSIKDRIGLPMIERAEKKGLLKKGGTIIEGTSGNTGVGLAMTATRHGYKMIFVMPDKQSEEKRNMLRAYGAQVVVTPTAVMPEDERSYYKVSDRLVAETPLAYKPDQYHNPANPEAHYRTTGPEIWEQTEGKITHFIASMGTGGTITGVGKFLKEKNKNIKVIGIDPVGSVFYDYWKTGKIPKLLTTYKVEGVGEDFMPTTIDFSVIDEVIQVSDQQSFTTARRLAKTEGILVGGSSGMALFGALAAVSKLNKNAVAVVILPESGRNYLTKFYSDFWMRENGFAIEDVKQATAKDVLATKKGQKIVMLSVSDTVKKAIGLMKKHDFSQIPVVSGKKLVGKVSERDLLNSLFAKTAGSNTKLSGVVDTNITTIFENETIEYVSALLSKHLMAVVLDKNSKPLGVLTRIDLIQFLSS